MAAEVGGGDGKKRPRIDMTPMVDLGFLLLTFFVLTTTMSNPKAMQIIVPAPDDAIQNPEDRPVVPGERVLTFMLTGQNRCYWYMGTSSGETFQLNLNGYGGGQIRNLVKEKQASVLRDPKLARFTDRDLIVMIKVSEDATYQNLVDMLDEMAITRQSKYMLVNLTPEEVAIIKDYEEAQGLQSSILKTIDIIGLPTGGSAAPRRPAAAANSPRR